MGAAKAQQLPNADSVDMLLTNVAIQVECTAAVNDMYNFRFEPAENVFAWLRRTYTNHPLPYFLFGLSYWWRMMPNETSDKYDKEFLAYMDSTILMAEQIIDKKPKNAEAAFFLAGAYGFKGRLYSERKNWGKATFAGKKALKYMEIAAEKGDLSPEFLLGDGLYNYYSIWIPENYAMLKPVLWFFKKGNKKTGIEQLEKVVGDAFYSKTEAQYFLMRIYADENQPEKAFETSSYLYRTFPENPYFHRYYARMLYTRGQLSELETVASTLLAHIDSGRFGYEEISGRYAAYYLASIYRMRNDNLRAKLFYTRAVIFSERIKSYDAGYYLYALAELGKMAAKEGKIVEARDYYQKIVIHADKKHATLPEAKDYLKKTKKEVKKK